MKVKTTLLAALLVSVILTGCKKTTTPPPQKDPSATPAASEPKAKAPEVPAVPAKAEIGQKAASLEGLTYIKGGPVTFENGNIYVVEFWATWCPPCRDSIPHLTKIQEEYKDKGVTVLGISTEKETEKVKSFVAEQGDKMDYHVALDPEFKVAKGYMHAYRQNGIPTAFIVDNGNVVWLGHPMAMDGVLKQVVAGTFVPDTGDSAKEAAPVAKETPKEGASPVFEETPKEETPAAEIGQKATSLEGLTMIKGEPFKFQDGKFYVVEFWATWCPPCRRSIPHLTELQKAFKDKGVTFIGISNEEDIEKVKAFVAEQGDKMDYRVAMDPERKVSKGYMQAYQQRGIPTAFVVDSKGNVAWLGHPMELDDVLEQVVAGTFDPEAYAKAKAEREAAYEAIGKLSREYVSMLMKGASIETSRPLAEKIIALDDAGALEGLVWQITSMPNIDEASRDYEIALKAIKRAYELTKGENAVVLDRYSQVLEKTGKPEEALVKLQKAVEMSGDNEELQGYLKKRLGELQKSLEEKTANSNAEGAAEADKVPANDAAQS